MKKICSFNYDEITLQNIDDNKYLEFICDGDKKIIIIGDKNFKELIKEIFEKQPKQIIMMKLDRI